MLGKLAELTEEGLREVTGGSPEDDFFKRIEDDERKMRPDLNNNGYVHA